MTDDLLTIIAEDGRVFYDDSDNVEELLKKCIIPIKAVYKGGVKVWPTK